MQTSKNSWRLAQVNIFYFKLFKEMTTMFYFPQRGFRKTATPGYYNQRFKPS